MEALPEKFDAPADQEIENQSDYQLCTGSLDCKTSGRHFFVFDALGGKRLLLRVMRNGICMLPVANSSELPTVSILDREIELGDAFGFRSCTLDYKKEKNALEVNMPDKRTHFSFHGPRIEELYKLIQQKCREWQIPAGPDTPHSHAFLDSCKRLEQFIYSHHITERHRIHAHSITDILGNNLYELIHASKKSAEVSFVVATVTGLLLGVLGGVIIASATAADQREMWRDVKRILRRRFPSATKHGYLYFVTDAPTDHRVFYFKDGHFGLVVDNTKKEPGDITVIERNAEKGDKDAYSQSSSDEVLL